MLLPHKKKDTASLIVASMGAKSPHGDFVDKGGEGEGDEGIELETVAGDMISAMRKGDAKGLAELLKHFLYLADDDDDVGEEPDHLEME